MIPRLVGVSIFWDAPMSRGKKLIIVGFVLAVGLVLAWPFRRTADEPSLDSVARVASAVPGSEEIVATPPVSDLTSQLRTPAPHVVAKMTSMGDAANSTQGSASRPSRQYPPTASFDLANHPALALPLAPQQQSPVTPPVPPAVDQPRPHYLPAETQHLPTETQSMYGRSRPAYETTDRGRVSSEQPREVRHVVENSDTLEKLAKRYLGDEGRSLEIFDLNRDVLDNPHLLPIDAELRLPADARTSLD